MFKKLFLFAFLIILPFYEANASIIITEWKKQVSFTDYGKEITMNIKGKTQLEQDFYYKNWFYVFDPDSKIEITKAEVKNRNFKTFFNSENNTLTFQFDDAFNDEILEFYFKYKRYDESFKLTKYMRESLVSVPKFLGGSKGELVVSVPTNWLVYSYHPNFIENLENNSYSWKGIAQKDGLIENFAMTLKKAKWQIVIQNILIGTNSFQNINMSVPLYFQGGNHFVEDLKIFANHKNAEISSNKIDGYIDIKFRNLNSRLAQVNISAIIQNGNHRYHWTKALDPSKFISVSTKESSILSGIINSIKNQSNPNNIPEHIKIAEWVHNYINYDESYIEKSMSTEEILKEKKGVCVHFALLYEKMLRTTGIPATAITGLSYDTHKHKFQQHSWVLVHINGEWLAIDPTWGIYSGRVPVSHIFAYKDTSSSIKYTVFDYPEVDHITANIREEVEFLE
jgi:hypothetical protein